MGPQRIDQLLAEATGSLLRAGVGEGRVEARLLLQHLTGWSRAQLLLHGADLLDASRVRRYRELVAQRRKRIPLQYLTGVQEFWSLEFMVSPAVLIPRPETEFMLEQVLATCTTHRVDRALDLCTGSGVIATVLARELETVVVASDISLAALQVARTNFLRLAPRFPILPVCSDLLAAFRPCALFDLIVSNPPYVAEETIDQLEPEVGRAEPRLALSGGPGGMECIKRIAASALQILRPTGWLFLEIGADQGAQALRLFTASPGYGAVELINDWADRPRVLKAQRAVLP